MVTIGGKTKVKKATQPQFVVKLAEDKNLFLSIKHDDKGLLNLDWIGDPNAATKFDAKEWVENKPYAGMHGDEV